MVLTSSSTRFWSALLHVINLNIIGWDYFQQPPAAKTKGALDSPSFEGILKASFPLEDCNDFSASDDRSFRSACG